MFNNNSLYGKFFRTRTFKQIFPTMNDFVTAATESQIPQVLSEDNLKTLYCLLYARYGNSNVSSSDENQFKYQVYSTIFMYGTAWQKRLEIQSNLSKLTDDEILKGSTAIYNTALNPGTAPGTQTVEELNFINSQNVTKYKKGKLEGYAILADLIKTDVTRDFIDKFKPLFITFVQPEAPLLYPTFEGDEN